MLEFGNGGKGEGRLRWIVLYVDTKQTKVVVWDVDTKVGETKKKINHHHHVQEQTPTHK